VTFFLFIISFSGFQESGDVSAKRPGEREQPQAAGAAHRPAGIGCQGAGSQGATDSGQCPGALQLGAGQIRDAHCRPGDAGSEVGSIDPRVSQGVN